MNTYSRNNNLTRYILLCIVFIYSLSLAKSVGNKFELPDMLFIENKYKDAVSLYENILENTKTSKKERIYLLTQIGTCYEKLLQYDRAISYFNKALLIKRKNSTLQLKLAQLYELTDLYDQALYHYYKVIKLKGDLYQAYYGIGRIYQKRGLNSEAIRNFHQAILQKPTPELYRTLSFCYESIKDIKTACAMLKQALSLEPNRDDYIKLGFLYSLNKEYDLSIETFSKALSINPNDEEVMFHLVVTYYKKGKYEVAKNLLKGILQINPASSLSHFLLGVYSFFEGNIAQAKVEVEKAHQLAKTPLMNQYSRTFYQFISSR